jgi:rhamnogalacturonyl hydrolase YesR
MAGIARVLDYMPKNYPARPKYVAQLREMAAAVIKVQGEDGLWRSGLLDPQAYPLPEASGSAFIAYALARGVNQGMLDRKICAPAARKAWAGLLAHVYADGRLGCIQPVGAAPGQFKATSSYVYGVGAFLLAGSQMDRLHL